jgi:extracellular elastinolytic metalloproteinase
MHYALLLPLLTRLACVVAAIDYRVLPRRSLSFGPTLPHAYFDASPTPVPSHLKSSKYDLKSITTLANGYIKEILGYPKNTFWVREDSYLDKASGIWHVYASQFVPESGVEIANARIQLSILDGEVLAISNSVSEEPSKTLWPF